MIDVMSAIEAEEGFTIAELGPKVRAAYADQFSEHLWDDSEPAADAGEVDRALASMSNG